MSFQFSNIHHIQLSGPIGCEDTARNFYSNVLGFEEIDKPETLKKRGGVWFKNGPIEIHIGIEELFTAPKKAHPALEIENLEAFINHLEKNNISFIRDELLPGYKRIYIRDPFGNRMEVLEKKNKI